METSFILAQDSKQSSKTQRSFDTLSQ